MAEAAPSEALSGTQAAAVMSVSSPADCGSKAKKMDMNSVLLFLLRSILLCCALTMAMPGPLSAASALTFKFVRMLPARQQPWHLMATEGTVVDDPGVIYAAGPVIPGSFENHWIRKFSWDGKPITNWQMKKESSGFWPRIISMAIDKDKNVYALDYENGLINKFSPAGKLITKWGGRIGEIPGQFAVPAALAVDGAADVYVVDASLCNVQKFTSDGVLKTTWGGKGSSDGLLLYPGSVAVDKAGGFVYVSDSGNHRIQKFTLDGRFINKWGSYGQGDGQFSHPSGITVDWEGNVHVADWGNSRIQKFTPDGRFILKWNKSGWGADGFLAVHIAADNAGGIYNLGGGLEKYTSDGVFVNAWRGQFPGYKELSQPVSLALDRKDNIYVADVEKDCIFKYTREGRFIKRWGSEGKGDGQFNGPIGIAVDKAGYVYVLDGANCRIQKFSSNGRFITKWGSFGEGPGKFYDPERIAVDEAGYVYVGDSGGWNNVHKFDRNGKFILSWQIKKHLSQIRDIAIDKRGNVYLVESDSFIEKYSADGKFITRWGGWRKQEGKLYGQISMAFDRDGNILVMDSLHINKFTPGGQFIGRWGKPGHEAGQISGPWRLAVGKDGLIYSLENTRIQVFRELSAPYRNKAIILAGRGSLRDNTIRDQTEINANFAYRTLLYQGFPKENIFYLSADGRMDTDGNGKSDDVSALATSAKLDYALTDWAAGAKHVVIYLTGPGEAEGLALNAKESLSPDDMAAWLDELQAKITGRIILVVDASRSGSFVERLSAGASEKRIVISSTASDEKAWFVHHGTVSFSSYFWTRIFNGDDLGAAFSHAREAMELGSYGTQHAQLKAGGEGPASDTSDPATAGAIHIGNGTPQREEIPKIASALSESISGSDAPEGSVRIVADGVTATDYIARVWAVILPPATTPGSRTGSVHELPSIDLQKKGSGRYEAIRAGMSEPGTYRIAVYAMDRYGNTSLPTLTAFTAGSQ